MEKQVELLSDPIFGEIQMAEKGTHIKRDAYLVKQPIKLKSNRNNLATNVCAINKLQHKEMKEIKQNDIKNNCLFCLQDHVLDDCLQFSKITHREKINFLKEKGACFGCLSIGHLSKNCNKRITCKICKKKKQTHPTVIHIHFKKKKSDVQCSEPEPAVNNTLVSSKAVGGQKGAGSNGILPILPVQVKAKKKKAIK